VVMKEEDQRLLLLHRGGRRSGQSDWRLTKFSVITRNSLLYFVWPEVLSRGGCAIHEGLLISRLDRQVKVAHVPHRRLRAECRRRDRIACPFARFRAAVSNELRLDVRLLAVEDAPTPNASPRPPPQSHLARPSRIKNLPGRLKRGDPFRASSASCPRRRGHRHRA
jgi:hypothetical protein